MGSLKEMARDPEKHRASNRKWREANKEKGNAASRKHREANKERVNEQKRRRYANTPKIPTVYVYRIGPNTVKIGYCGCQDSRFKNIQNAADQNFARPELTAHFETNQLAHDAEQQLHYFLEFEVKINRLPFFSTGEKSEQFHVEHHPMYIDITKGFLQNQPGFIEFAPVQSGFQLFN